MNTPTRIVATLALALLATATTGQARAATHTGTLAVSVTVQSVCAVDGGSLDFGSYNGGQSSNADATGSINYMGCAAGTLTFALDGGQSGDETARQLKSASGQSLAYQLYRNSARTQIWGTGTNTMGLQLLVAGSGSIPVYGRIPGGQAATAGTYTDAVNITLTF